MPIHCPLSKINQFVRVLYDISSPSEDGMYHDLDLFFGKVPWKN
jgi:hypothetical protein